MDDAVGVGGGEGRHDVADHRQRLSRRHPPLASQKLLQRFAAQQLHGEKDLVGW